MDYIFSVSHISENDPEQALRIEKTFTDNKNLILQNSMGKIKPYNKDTNNRDYKILPALRVAGVHDVKTLSSLNYYRKFFGKFNYVTEIGNFEFVAFSTPTIDLPETKDFLTNFRISELKDNNWDTNITL